MSINFPKVSRDVRWLVFVQCRNGQLDTLAAAYAEDGQFSLAVASVSRALVLATAQRNSTLASEIRGRLRLYKVNKPYHVEWLSQGSRAALANAPRVPERQ